MSKCRRCHRTISNKKSVQHGFGPVCWSKEAQIIIIEGVQDIQTGERTPFILLKLKELLHGDKSIHVGRR